MVVLINFDCFLACIFDSKKEKVKTPFMLKLVQ
jgi:hypothetical protein